jgi:hypothetical protein
MVIERTDDEVIIRLPAYVNTEGLQRFVNLLSYKEATAKSEATQAQVDELVKEVKKGRWAKNGSKHIK